MCAAFSNGTVWQLNPVDVVEARTSTVEKYVLKVPAAFLTDMVTCYPEHLLVTDLHRQLYPPAYRLL
jgi:hypothetical protein